jgi:hypothetical protein
MMNAVDVDIGRVKETKENANDWCDNLSNRTMKAGAFT